MVNRQPEFDAKWKKLALEGDEVAVGQLVRVSLEMLYHFCFYRVGRNKHLCEEVVQETIVRAISQLDDYQPERAANRIFPWLTGLARNEIRRVLAREPSGPSLEAMWARMDEDLREILQRLESEPFADEVLQREETREMVNATMSQLPPRYREALEAKYVFRQSVRDMAQDKQTSEKAVESLLARARQAFRESFMALTRNLNAELDFP